MNHHRGGGRFGLLPFYPQAGHSPRLQAEPKRRVERPSFDFRLLVPFDRIAALSLLRFGGMTRALRLAPAPAASESDRQETVTGCWLQPTALSALVAYRSCPMDQ